MHPRDGAGMMGLAEAVEGPLGQRTEASRPTRVRRHTVTFAHSFSGQGDVSIPFEDWNLHQLQVFYDAENVQIQVSACPLRMGHIFSQDAGQWWQVSKTLLMVDKE